MQWLQVFEMDLIFFSRIFDTILPSDSSSNSSKIVIFLIWNWIIPHKDHIFVDKTLPTLVR
jgi:hypothetical protein